MKSENLTATVTIDASATDVFAVLADPTTHAAIDGTGWVREPIDHDQLDHVDQIFGMRMYHDNYPDKHYEIANQVEVFDAPSAICWKPGQFSPDTGELSFGEWTWRYDLAPVGPEASEVTLTYDWSQVPAEVRRRSSFHPSTSTTSTTRSSTSPASQQGPAERDRSSTHNAGSVSRCRWANVGCRGTSEMQPIQHSSQIVRPFGSQADAEELKQENGGDWVCFD
jgi:hypothetical protein